MNSIRFALRQILKSPGYSIVVVLTLAFGIAVNSMLFGMVNQFFLRPMEVPGADRLVLILQRSAGWAMPHQISFLDFKDYREGMRTVRDLFVIMPIPAHLSAEGRFPERAWFEVVSPSAFQGLGLQAQLGRTLLPSDGEAVGAPLVAMLTHHCWQERFGGDPEIVGRAVMINGKSFTVVGVARPEFQAFSYTMTMAGFVPVSAIDAVRPEGAGLLQWRGATAWRAMGMLAPGVTVDEAAAEAAVITERLAREYPDDHKQVSSVVMLESRARPDPMFAEFLPAVMALFAGMVVLVLIIACANVANLMLARTAARQKELTMRSALGASRWTIIRQLLIESLVLAAIAGVVGWYLADWMAVVFQRFAPAGDIPARTDLKANWMDHLFLFVIAAVAALGSGILPALRASRIDLVGNLKAGAGGAFAPGRHRLRNILVVGQVTFSLVVLCCAGLFARSLVRIQTVDLGFRTEGLLMASFDLHLQGYDEARAAQFRRAVVERVRALPGVTAAGLTSSVPFSYTMTSRDTFPENPTLPLPDETVSAGYAQISPEYFDTMGLRLLHGRMIAPGDTPGTTRVAVINQAFAQACWPGQDAIGRRLQPWKGGPWMEVVGVAATAKYVMMGEAPRPFVYVPVDQDNAMQLSILVRAQGDPATLTASLRAALRELDPHLPPYDVRTMDELMGRSVFALMPMRMGSLLAGIQGMIGLMLALMGLYAVVSFGVTQRTREIGIRIAIGARPGEVVRAMVREGLRLTLAGVALGLLCSAALGLVLSRILFGLAAFDAPALVGVAALLFLVAFLACWMPARRASRVDPVSALRAE